MRLVLVPPQTPATPFPLLNSPFLLPSRTYFPFDILRQPGLRAHNGPVTAFFVRSQFLYRFVLYQNIFGLINGRARWAFTFLALTLLYMYLI